MEIAEYDNLQNDLRKACATLEAGAQGIIGIVWINLLVPTNAIRSYISSRKLIKATRNFMALCSAACDTGDCLGPMHEKYKGLRDQCARYISMLESFPSYLLKWPALRLHRIIMGDWDDLAEDCLIGSDIEIRTLINKIANAA